MIASVLSIIQYVITPNTPPGKKFFCLRALKSSALSRNEFEDTSKKKAESDSVQTVLQTNFFVLFSPLFKSTPTSWQLCWQPGKWLTLESRGAPIEHIYHFSNVLTFKYITSWPRSIGSFNAQCKIFKVMLHETTRNDNFATLFRMVTTLLQHCHAVLP